jgi:hypothetical protein
MKIDLDQYRSVIIFQIKMFSEFASTLAMDFAIQKRGVEGEQ